MPSEPRDNLKIALSDKLCDDAAKISALFGVPPRNFKEEIRELEEAVSESSDTSLDPHVKEELGDLIFAVTNLARHLKADAESALENTTKKFSRRFRAVEAGAKAQGRNLKDMTLAEMDALWDEAKSAESMH